MSAITAIADALVAALKTAGFTEAERRPLPYVKREDCADRKCVVICRSVTYGDGHRADYDQLCEVSILVQKGVADPHSNTEIDPLLENVATLAALWGEGGALRSAVLAGADYESGPEHPTGTCYEFQQLLELKLFTSVTLVRYRIEG